VPNWKDIFPRVGAAYDLFGDGKTAIKGSVGKYGVLGAAAIAQASAGAARIATTARRTWTDTNGNFFPDCNLTNPDTNGEWGRLSNVNLGLPITATQYAPDYLQGWGVRTYNWETSLELQQELRPGVALTAGYYRTWYGNLTATENLRLTPADFDP